MVRAGHGGHDHPMVDAMVALVRAWWAMAMAWCATTIMVKPWWRGEHGMVEG